jgi:hypothetical protein
MSPEPVVLRKEFDVARFKFQKFHNQHRTPKGVPGSLSIRDL